jgi:hypothetical protein
MHSFHVIISNGSISVTFLQNGIVTDPTSKSELKLEADGICFSSDQDFHIQGCLLTKKMIYLDDDWRRIRSLIVNGVERIEDVKFYIKTIIFNRTAIVSDLCSMLNKNQIYKNLILGMPVLYNPSDVNRFANAREWLEDFILKKTQGTLDLLLSVSITDGNEEITNFLLSEKRRVSEMGSESDEETGSELESDYESE